MAKQYRKTVRNPKTGDELVVGNAGEYAQLTQGMGWVDVDDTKTSGNDAKTATDTKGDAAKSDEPAPTVAATQTGGKTTTNAK